MRASMDTVAAALVLMLLLMWLGDKQQGSATKTMCYLCVLACRVL